MKTSIFQNNCCITTISHDFSKANFVYHTTDCVQRRRIYGHCCVYNRSHRNPPTRVLLVFVFFCKLCNSRRNTQCMFFTNSSFFPKYIFQFQCKSSKVQVYQIKFSSGISQNETIHSDYRSLVDTSTIVITHVQYVEMNETKTFHSWKSWRRKMLRSSHVVGIIFHRHINYFM